MSELRDQMAAKDATIERLTKELEDARLQDPNQWRREYWKHYNDLKARADSLAAELAKAREVLRKIASEPLFNEPFRNENRIMDRDTMIQRARDALPATPEPQPRSRVLLKKDGTITIFDEGAAIVSAPIAEQPGQAATAAELGMKVEAMNRTHDLTHSLLAHWLGLPWSPTLHGVATRRYYPHHAAEEAAVLDIQRFAKLVGADLVELAMEAGICDFG